MHFPDKALSTTETAAERIARSAEDRTRGTVHLQRPLTAAVMRGTEPPRMYCGRFSIDVKRTTHAAPAATCRVCRRRAGLLEGGQ